MDPNVLSSVLLLPLNGRKMPEQRNKDRKKLLSHSFIHPTNIYRTSTERPSRIQDSAASKTTKIVTVMDPNSHRGRQTINSLRKYRAGRRR